MEIENENERIVVGLDIGTTKVCAVVASIDEQDRIHILGVGKAPSEGLNRGVVVNIDKTVQAIKTAVEQAQLASGIEVNSVNVGIAGDHIRSIRSKGVITINNKDKEITVHDVERLLEDCQRIMLPPDQQILHVIPQEFVVDGQDGISDPVGMSGIRMEAEVHIITGLVSAAKNLYRCVERAGFQVADIILEPLASSYAVLDDEEKEAGVVLVDIGGGTTDLAVFQDNTIRHTAVIAIAGKKVTDDIRVGLSVLDDQAEKLKQQHGECFVDMIEEDESITIPGIAGRPPKEITKSILAKIIQARMEEILEIIAIEVKRSGYADSLSAGIVLSGGGALIKNICPLANEVLGIDAKIGKPLGLSGGLIEEVNSPIYATSVGLVLHAIKSGGPENQAIVPSSTKGSGVEKVMNSITQRMKSWFREL
ncbi:cell division protein FtsA [Rhodohalobacter sp.]|uniref:cell division protein FtsA n=1 Tax=Rhodohalobacter sp. TaxID=1974210 RepID=UPI002ACE679D|nr:cell division protein FtsA [Rhodohalobacter sp.]MDZ7756976.1 cell division protein FtsA [Rhodohalobacter sp.]